MMVDKPIDYQKDVEIDLERSYSRYVRFNARHQDDNLEIEDVVSVSCVTVVTVTSGPGSTPGPTCRPTPGPTTARGMGSALHCSRTEEALFTRWPPTALGQRWEY